MPKKLFLILSILITFLNVLSQEGFQFKKNNNKISIPFKSVNNLMFIAVLVNGVELNFLLDTGVKETILFSLDDKEEIVFQDIEKIKLKGFGNNNYVEGLKSSKNKLKIKDLEDDNHVVYIVLNQDFNLSSTMGIPVNGIIGSSFFKNYFVEIDYEKNKIFVYKNDSKIRKKLNQKFVEASIEIINSKPSITSKLVLDDQEINANLLIDSGNSDAIWLFRDSINKIKIPKKNIDDYLGHGFSGDIFGKRSKISKVNFNSFEFENPIVSFPDSLQIKNSNISDGRDGSIGSEILKRFVVVYDYKGKKVYFKKNSNYNLPFSFNKSGIEIQHDGLQWIQGTEELKNTAYGSINFDINSDKISNFRYKFDLKPVFKIVSVRKNSPASISGLLKDDIVISINKENIQNFSLQEINELLKSEDGKTINITIERNNKILKFKFQLKDIL